MSEDIITRSTLVEAAFFSISESKREMGSSEVVANGGGTTRLGNKSKYLRMDELLPQEQGGGGHEEGSTDTSLSNRRIESRRYVFASLNSVLLDYDIGVMSGCIIFMQKDLHITEVQQEVLVGILGIVSLLGSLAGGRTSDAVGRKWTIGLAAAASSFVVLMIGRLLAGVGIGFGIMIAPVYIAEISPAAARGTFTSFPEIFINLGILLGYVSNYAFSGLSAHISWRVMLAVGILPSVFIAAALFMIPETPRWLVMQKRVPEAWSVLLKITDSEEEAEERLAEIEEAAGVANTEKYEEKSLWLQLLMPSPVLRRMLIAGLGIQFFQQLTGIGALVYYSPTIFRDAGITSDNQVLAVTVAVGFFKTVFIRIAIGLIDHVGRKPLLYASTIGMTVCLTVLALGLSLQVHGSISRGLGIAATTLAVCGDVTFFSIGIGPICSVLSSEIYPLGLRAQAVALGAVVNRVVSGLVAMTFLSICNAISIAGAFFLFGAISAVSVIFIHKFIPETKGKSLEQVGSMFGDRHGEVELGDVEHLVQKE